MLRCENGIEKVLQVVELGTGNGMWWFRRWSYLVNVVVKIRIP